MPQATSRQVDGHQTNMRGSLWGISYSKKTGEKCKSLFRQEVQLNVDLTPRNSFNQKTDE